MKIELNRIYLCDVYKVGKLNMETFDFESRLVAKNVRMLKFGDRFLPIHEIKSPFEILKIKLLIVKQNGKEIEVDPTASKKLIPEVEFEEGKYFVSDVRPLFTNEKAVGKISLKELIKQRQLGEI